MTQFELVCNTFLTIFYKYFDNLKNEYFELFINLLKNKKYILLEVPVLPD